MQFYHSRAHAALGTGDNAALHPTEAPQRGTCNATPLQGRFVLVAWAAAQASASPLRLELASIDPGGAFRVSIWALACCVFEQELMRRCTPRSSPGGCGASRQARACCA